MTDPIDPKFWAAVEETPEATIARSIDTMTEAVRQSNAATESIAEAVRSLAAAILLGRSTTEEPTP